MGDDTRMWCDVADVWREEYHDCRFLYLVRAVGTDYIKVGMTGQHPKKRLDGSGTNSPFPLEIECLWAATPCAIEDMETSLHTFLDSRRTHGEWFCLSQRESSGLRFLPEWEDSGHSLGEVADLLGWYNRGELWAGLDFSTGVYFEEFHEIVVEAGIVLLEAERIMNARIHEPTFDMQTPGVGSD